MKTFSQTTINDPLTRRMFLRRSMLMGAGAAGVVALPAQALTSDPETIESEDTKDGYHMTDHIAEYYKSAEV